MNERGHERWRDDVAAYMLGALEPDEATALERHLERCDLCREQARWLRPAVRALPEGVERLKPPAGLRDRVLAEAEIAPRSSAPLRDLRRRTRSWLAGFGPRGRGWRPAAAAVVGTVALALVAIIAFEIGTYGGRDFVPETTTAQWGRAPGITAEVVREGSHGRLRLDNVHQLEGEKVLEAWVRRGAAVEPVPALFVPDDEGRAWTMIEGMEGVDRVMVTEEPKGGSSAPTSTPLVDMEMPE